MCSGRNLPSGSHHSAAIASNLATSAGSTVPAIAFTAFGPALVLAVAGIHSAAMKESPSHAGTAPRSGLYPPIEPFRQQVMEMPGGHRVYVEQCGRPDGAPVVVLHGGPGGGCSPGHAAVLRSRRTTGWCCSTSAAAAGRRPNASVENNTTWDLVADIERIRAELGIERWIGVRRLLGRLPRADLRPDPSRAGAGAGAARGLHHDPGRARLVLRRRRRRRSGRSRGRPSPG